jgi:exodeoxyribonuclease-3
VSSVYVPNGRAIDDPHYEYKLSWLDRLQQHLAIDASSDGNVIVTGDFNIAPTDADVHDPQKLAMSTHVTDAERARLRSLEEWGLSDLFRHHHNEERLFSWWDYRSGDFHMGRGLRIDLILGSRSMVERSEFVVVDRNARKGPSPSDHAPVLVDLK